jgi:cellulose synthase/poly-beta-1,6-N-acetylglucosamine synthase-like glycosyltransferase
MLGSAPLIELALTVGLLALAAMSTNLTLLWAARLLLPDPRVDRNQDTANARTSPQELPRVLLQLPLFNEGTLAKRILEQIADLDWPTDRLQVQVLDDSTEAASLAASSSAVEYMQNRGMDVCLVHRRQRTAFKAGALAAGLQQSQAPFVAVFDADFLPPRDFLRRTVGRLLTDQRLAYVQARWGHQNAADSLLTRAQSRLLDGHFNVEQTARWRLGMMVPFNGTCGVWRRAAIDDAGGWHGDTLTEDLDLSLRARFRGWRSDYLEDLVVPGILPVSASAWRVQQARWSKGFIQCLVKLAPQLWRSPTLPPWQRLLTTMQLAQPLAFLIGTFCVLLGLPFIAGAETPGRLLTAAALLTSLIGLLGPIGLLLIGGARSNLDKLPRDALAALLLSTGLILSNARAGAEAILGHRSAFIRTPKRREHDKNTLRLWTQGLPELAAGLALLAFTLFEQPLAIVSLTLVIGGLLTVGGLQLRESSERLATATLGV